MQSQPNSIQPIDRHHPTSTWARWTWLAAGCLLWILFSAYVLYETIDAPADRLSADIYREAGLNWLDRNNLYVAGKHRFLYLPQSAMFYSCFAAMDPPQGPPLYGETTYRLLTLILVASACLRLAQLAGGRHHPWIFTLISLMLLPIAATNARGGQANLLMLAGFVHAAVDLAYRRWWPAAIWLVLAVCVKPLALAMVVLVCLCYPRRMIARVLLIGLLAEWLPALWVGPTWLMRQYQLFFWKMEQAGHPVIRFADLQGLLYWSYLPVLPSWLITVLRALMVLAVIVAVIYARRTQGQRIAALALLGLATGFLMIFNPRTEDLSYLLILPSVAVLAAWHLIARDFSMMILWLAFCPILGLKYELVGRYHYWLPPWFGILFFLFLLTATFTGQLPAPLPSTHALNDGDSDATT